MIVGQNASRTNVATYETDTTDDHVISREGMKDMNGPLDPLHEGVVVSYRGTQRLGLLLKDIEDRLDRSAGCEVVEDLMSDQVGACSVLEFIQSGLKEGCQLWRWKASNKKGKWEITWVIS